MADKSNEVAVEKETFALKKLQAAAGFVDRSHAERLDWMYEQSALTNKTDNDKLMNMPVADQKDKDVEDVKKLGENTAGSLFLKSATRTTEDMKRKLREDPLFQIRQQEQNAKVSMMANPLIMAKMQKKEEKQRKKEQKKVKKAAKKEKKAMKKAAKAEGGKIKKKKKSSSSSSSSSASPAKGLAQPVGLSASQSRPRSRSPRRRADDSARSSGRQEALGPSGEVVDKREQFAKQILERRDAALASRGAAKRMTEEEKERRLAQMRADANRHEASKDNRIAAAEEKDREIEEQEKKARQGSDQKYFRDLREKAYMGEESGSVADRLRNQRHRRQKHLNDPLERDG